MLASPSLDPPWCTGPSRGVVAADAPPPIVTKLSIPRRSDLFPTKRVRYILESLRTVFVRMRSTSAEYARSYTLKSTAEGDSATMTSSSSLAGLLVLGSVSSASGSFELPAPMPRNLEGVSWASVRIGVGTRPALRPCLNSRRCCRMASMSAAFALSSSALDGCHDGVRFTGVLVRLCFLCRSDLNR